ncbi:glycine betaine ABC transporter substrate-binding protein [Burkholderia gladioli]|jgi:osmoprotectant transport system substrate-binding protein|uniref:glycine betaine ABC transporter substrate-binding protein n=1 Tax=Burkholderia TaxID=32008 RepID=UPI000468632C|nr:MULTISPECIES: glycine betaine ABC transporter substrate-binding protein [Burkholderia]ASD84225.1 glycine/betaine ABC transporter substrate-binding protein [Burkholderia gladioli pv. gladioli]AWY51646.1 glycine/betaine ABC transporter substrate-binding protein [Burkholderia gladioli pv. gladioli]KAF1058132.1 Osmoprotectant-binding protein OsmX [Burkholderia gladioli]KKJ02408.1 glycine/betaine ABC transporter substrate-binding protein [Burkholderia gladioli]MBA1367059.1 glycine betaine ABC tr
MTGFERISAMARRALAVVLAAASLGALASAPAAAQALTVGGKNFTEQYVLAEITSQYLRARGYTIQSRTGLGSVLLRSALENGQIDVMWDYTGTAALVYDKIKEKLPPDEMYRRVKAIDARRGLVWLDASPLNNTYALALPAETARKTGIRTISQLAAKIAADPKGTRHTFGMDAEFANRPDGLKPLEAAYHLNFSRSETKQMDSGLVYTALRNNQLTIGLVYTTDGRVKGFGIVPLEDDLHFFPPYNATPVVREPVLKAHPKLAVQLNALSAALNNDVMLEMNKRVDIDGVSVQQVAADFLRTHTLP